MKPKHFKCSIFKSDLFRSLFFFILAQSAETDNEVHCKSQKGDYSLLLRMPRKLNQLLIIIITTTD